MDVATFLLAWRLALAREADVVSAPAVALEVNDDGCSFVELVDLAVAFHYDVVPPN